MTTNAKVERIETEINLDEIDDLNESVDLQLVEEDLPEEEDEEQDLPETDPDDEDFEFDLNEVNLPETETTTKRKKEVVVEEEEEQPKTKTKKKESRSNERIQQLIAEREQAKAIAAELAKTLQTHFSENQTDRTRLAETDVSLWENAVTKAESDFASALDEGDSKKVAAAQKALNDAQFKLNIASARKTQATEIQKPEDYVKDIVTKAVNANPVRVQPVQEDDEENDKVVDWIKRNQFVLAKDEVQKTAVAVYEMLTKEGYEQNSEEILGEVEDRLTYLYPELQRWFEKTKTTKKAKVKVEDEEEEEQPKPQKKAPPTAGQSRSTNTKTQENKPYQVKNGKVVINPTQDDRSMAANLGIDLKEYLKEKIKYEQVLKRGRSRETSIFE